MSAVRIGRVVEGGKVHISTSRCPILTNRPIAITANPAKVDTKSVCRWCAKPANLAAAHRENAYGTGWSAAVEKFLANLGPQSTLNPAGYNVEHDAERAEIAKRWAEYNAPVEVATPKLSKLGQAAANAGYAAAKRERTVTRRSANSRAKLHNLFAAKAA